MNSSGTENFAGHCPLEALIIGYGNVLRTDDGAGPAIVARLAIALAGNPLCKCIAPQQLAPEHAEELFHARRTLFIDASTAIAAGKIRIVRLAPAGFAQSLTHHVAPQSLLWICQQLFNQIPQAWSIEIGAKNLSVGQNLSPAVAHSAARLTSHLASRLRRWTKNPDSSACSHASKESPHVCS
jgi:hydrogenase maturation protease